MWVCDNSGNVNSDGNVVQALQPAKQSTKFNALWNEGDWTKDSKQAYWEITLLNTEPSNVWFGLSNESMFGAGWKLKGLLYGGNLSDGGALVKSQFGPTFKEGDVIGMHVSIETNLQVSYYINGKLIGMAFDITGEVPLLHPVVCFNSGPAKLSIVRSEAPTPSSDIESEPPNDIFHAWMLSGPEVDASITDDTLQTTLKIAAENETTARVQCKCGNSLSTRICKNESGEWIGSGDHVASTMMMVTGDMQLIENKMSSILSTIKSVSANEDNSKLFIECVDESNTIVMHRHIEICDPATRDQIRWLN